MCYLGVLRATHTTTYERVQPESEGAYLQKTQETEGRAKHDTGGCACRRPGCGTFPTTNNWVSSTNTLQGERRETERETHRLKAPPPRCSFTDEWINRDNRAMES